MVLSWLLPILKNTTKRTNLFSTTQTWKIKKKTKANKKQLKQMKSWGKNHNVKIQQAFHMMKRWFSNDGEKYKLPQFF